MQRILVIILLLAVALCADAAPRKRSAAAKQKTEQKSSKKSSKKNGKGKSGKKTAKKARKAAPVAPPRLYTDYDGIDVSSYQKDIDWEKVCADKRIKFVYIKATEGATYTSPHFEYNIKNARRHGLKVGSYHFLRTTSSLRSQFDNFIKSARREEQDLVPLIDFENRGNWSVSQIADSLEAFAQMIRRHYGCRPMIYTMSSFYNKYLAGKFKDYPLFIARYSDSQPELSDGAKCLLWQYTDQGRVEGIDHAVDLCLFANGAKLSGILMRPQATKLSKYDNEKAVGQVPSTPAKFKSHADTAVAEMPAVDESMLSKKELKEREQMLKERQKEERRLRKLREKAVKDSLKLEKKREKARRDSIKRAEKEARKRTDAEHGSVEADIDAEADADATQGGNQSRYELQNNDNTNTENAKQGSTYKQHYSTRRRKN